MHRHSHITIPLLSGFVCVLLTYSPVTHDGARAADGQNNPESQAPPSQGAEVTIPDGVIGVSLHVGAERVGDTAVLYVAHVLPEGPAQQAGLKQGDELTTVDGVAVTGKTYEQVALMVRGEPGSVVKLGVKGEGDSRQLSVTRVASQTLYKRQRGLHGDPAR
ncbi:MAG: exported protein of unknown function, domain [Nitrospira sp.]|jgi:S1-C subfamily serine protease|nr:exported protein of unknown function, domain [Nitrospira sp.]